jgi:hypothetical protein
MSIDDALRENHELTTRMIEAENALLRESLDYFASYVDPLDALRDRDGEVWTEVGAGGDAGAAVASAFASEQQLSHARAACRALERNNEFAINGHENRISYIVGTGHTYKVVARKGATVDPLLVEQAQDALDTFCRENRWRQRQQEIVRRRDRDGEVFLRFFTAADGQVRLRFVEPSQVFRPGELAERAAASFGVETEPDDVETVLAYWIDGAAVDADEIQHRKLGVDSNVKRGVPLFYPVRENLRRAEKLLANMATVADIQTAIAMIRRHDRAGLAAAQSFRAATATATLASGATGDASYFRRYAPGTILDAPKSIEYEFPAAGLDASRYVRVLQAILRSIASRLVFPEFMLTSDASNANYASTLVAEGPAVKVFQRWQADTQVDDLAVMDRVIAAAVRAGRLPSGARDQIEIQVGKPRVATRDEKQEAEVNQLYHQLGVKSRQTIAAEIGLDYDQEQANLAADVQRDAEA